jgi:hypothetical protein
MFLLRSWTQPDSPLPYQVVCDACKENVAFESERERWRWSQDHVCLGPAQVFYLDEKRKKRDAQS